jgi:vacuolar-type H+-ATPase subunit F/Vma7
MTRIFTIGSEIFVTGFRLQGIDGIVASESSFDKILDIVMADKSIAIVFLEEDLYYSSRERMDKLKVSGVKPLFIEVPLQRNKDRPDLIAQLIRKNIGITLD